MNLELYLINEVSQHFSRVLISSTQNMQRYNIFLIDKGNLKNLVMNLNLGNLNLLNTINKKYYKPKDYLALNFEKLSINMIYLFKYDETIFFQVKKAFRS